MNNQSPSEPLVNYVRVHRNRAGLSQSELGRVLGYDDSEPIARHEHFRSLPPLLVAIGYEVVFQEPLCEIFAGLRYSVGQAVEQRLGEFEAELRGGEVHGFRRKAHGRKLEWLEGRRLDLKQ
jgi:DNA-binding XRE family transcriptional regulator